MYAAIGFIVVVLATVLACVAPRLERIGGTLELAAGLLLVAGLAVIGSQLGVLFR